MQVRAYWGSTALTITQVVVKISSATTTSWFLRLMLTGVDTTHIWSAGSFINDASLDVLTGTQIDRPAPGSVAVTSGAQTLDLRFSESVAVVGDGWRVEGVTMQRII
jgi:hypothetical protein